MPKYAKRELIVTETGVKVRYLYIYNGKKRYTYENMKHKEDSNLFIDLFNKLNKLEKNDRDDLCNTCLEIMEELGL